MLVPVYYVEVKGFECAFVDLIESWDGSYYGETNVKVHTGPSREVVAGSATLEGTWLERTVAIVSVPSKVAPAISPQMCATSVITHMKSTFQTVTCESVGTFGCL